MDYHFTFKKKMGVTVLIIFQEGQNQQHPLEISRII